MEKNKKIISLCSIILFLICFICVCFYNYKKIDDNLIKSKNERIIKKELEQDEKLKGFILAWHTMKNDYYSHIDSNELLNRSLNALHNKEDVYYTKTQNFLEEYIDYFTGIKFYKKSTNRQYFIAQIDDDLNKYKDKYNLYYGREVFKINNKNINNISLSEKKKISLSKEYTITLKDNNNKEFNVKLPNYFFDQNEKRYDWMKSNEKRYIYEKDGILIININDNFNDSIENILDSLNEEIKDGKKYNAYIIDFRNNQGGSLVNEQLLSCIFNSDSVKVNAIKESGKQIEMFTNKSLYEKVSEQCYKYEKIKKYFENKKLVIWMNENSLSSTELLIASLILSDRVKFTVGSKTYGKGIAQSNIKLPGYQVKFFFYTNYLLALNNEYSTQIYGVEPNINIEFKGKEVKRMEDSEHYISPPENLKKIPVKKYKEYIYDKKDLDKYDEIYYNVTKENLNLQIQAYINEQDK